MHETDTTAVLQTPPGRGGIAVIVLAGPATAEILSRAFRPLLHRSASPKPADARRPCLLQLGHMIDDLGPIDEAVVSLLDSGAAEINIHGGPAVCRAVLHRLGELGATVAPAPAAAPVTFPLAHPRYSNPAIGRELLDALPRAKSLLVASALARQWSGGISELARSLIASLPPAREAPPQDRDQLAVPLRRAASRLAAMLRVLQPAEVVLAGPPNAGKSTLANAMVGREVSIVHETAGTTRDWVRELALLRGLPVWLTDTAGLWEAPGDIDAEAVRRARLRIQQADVVLLLGAGQASEVPVWLNSPAPHAPRLLHVSAKCDVCPPSRGAAAAVSAATGEGLDELASAVLAALDLADFDPADPAAFTARQADLLSSAAHSLARGDFDSSLAALRRLLE